MVQRGMKVATLAGASAWLALTFVGIMHAAGERPGSFAVACVLLALPVATAAAARSAASFWRGPDLISFTRADSEPCTPDEASYVRLSSQLRGMMGGAGFLYPRRLAAPVVAWVTAALAGVGALSGPVNAVVGPWPVLVTVAGAALAFLLPARPYYYRDTTGGGAIVCPPPAASRLKRRAEIATRVARGEQVEATAPAPAVPCTQARPDDQLV